MSMSLQSPHVRLMIEAAKKAGGRLSRDFGEVEHLQVSVKGPRDFVTSADIKAEEIIKEMLQEKRPGYGFLAEEGGEEQGKGEYRWIIDPIDGTGNFIRGLPFFAVSIALQKLEPKPEIVAGVVFAPILGELFWTERGVGAYCGQRRLKVSSHQRLDQAMVSSYLRNRDPEIEQANINLLSTIPANVRIIGSASLELAYVAAGKLDGFWCRSIKPWDIAAGMLLVKEGRGEISCLKGRGDPLDQQEIVASNGAIHSELQAELKKHY